jgi:predicted enzyme related to lactoylglutathione lyase
MHRSRICQFVIDVSDLDQGVAFWAAALDGEEEETSETSRHVYRRIRVPDSEIRVLLQKTGDCKASKERMHIDVETDNVEAEVKRLETLGAVRWDHQQERGFDFWVLQDPWGNEFCVLQEEFPKLLARRRPWSAARPLELADWTSFSHPRSTGVAWLASTLVWSCDMAGRLARVSDTGRGHGPQVVPDGVRYELKDLKPTFCN